MHVVHETSTPCRDDRLDAVSAEFAGQIATAVWLTNLTDAAAREALWSYAMACYCGARWRSMGLWRALLAEYRRRREGQDACS